MFDLDIDTAQMTRVDQGQASVPVLDRFPWLPEIIADVDGDILEQIGRLWYRGKDWPDPEVEHQPPANVAGWNPGQEVSWDEAYFGVRQDLFPVGERTYEAVELYCVLPDCDCGSVRVRFDDLKAKEPRFVGLVTIEKSGACTLEVGDRSPDLLDRLWAAYQKRHRTYPERHARRYERMKSFGSILLAHHAAKSVPKVGPNQPCPCGSGKKYKKCCWRKALARRL